MFLRKLILIPLLMLSFSVCLISQCVGDCDNGVGKFTFKDGSVYEGTWELDSNGVQQMKNGVMQYKNGIIYEGAFEKRKKHGYGTELFPAGHIFIGEYVNNKKVSGTVHYATGDRYTGDFNGNNKHGQGTLYRIGGTVESGYWENNILLGDNNDTEGEAANPSDIYVIVAGVANYADEGFLSISGLDFSDDDALKFAGLIKDVEHFNVPSENVVVLLNQDATKEKIAKEAKELFSRADKNDRIVFYFSGHGDENAILPFDSNLLEQNFLKYREIKEIFQKSSARSKYCILDACYAGNMVDKSKVFKNNFDNIKEFQKAKIAVFMSSRSTETSSERRDLQQGLFSYYLINGLKGYADDNSDGIVSMVEIFKYVKNNVLSESLYRQSPVMYGQFHPHSIFIGKK